MSTAVESIAGFDPEFALGRRELAELCDRLLDFLGFPDADVDVRVVGDREMARLNSEFLGMVGPTNVLSFPAAEGSDFCPDMPEVLDGEWEGEMPEPVRDDLSEEDAPFLGSIALSADTLAREAFLYGQKPMDHLVRLLVHAMLHLAGFDHGPEMYDLTDRAVEAFAQPAD